MDGYLSYRFKQNLFRAVNKFKQENPGVLEEITRARKKREKNGRKNADADRMVSAEPS